MPLQAMPRAVPHMELPLYQNENAGIANRPEMAKITMAGSVMAPRSNRGHAGDVTAEGGENGEGDDELEQARGKLANGDADAVVDEHGAEAGHAALEAPAECG